MKEMIMALSGAALFMLGIWMGYQMARAQRHIEASTRRGLASLDWTEIDELHDSDMQRAARDWESTSGIPWRRHFWDDDR